MEYKSLMGPGTGGPGNMARDLTTEQMQILDATAAVCTYTKTRYEAKSHGGYDVYEDDKIRVELDTYVRRLRWQRRQFQPRRVGRISPKGSSTPRGRSRRGDHRPARVRYASA